MTKRRGPRTGGEDAREQILEAARRQFAAHGVQGATLRRIAADAGVDVALISYYFTSKSGLFIAALQLPVDPVDAIGAEMARGTEDLGPRLVRRLLTVWDDPVTGAPLISVVRSASAQPELLREFLQRRILVRLREVVDGPDADLRAAAAASQMLGIVLTRYVVGVEPIASASLDEIVALVGPTIQRYLVPAPTP